MLQWYFSIFLQLHNFKSFFVYLSQLSTLYFDFRILVKSICNIEIRQNTFFFISQYYFDCFNLNRMSYVSIILYYIILYYIFLIDFYECLSVLYYQKTSSLVYTNSVVVVNLVVMCSYKSSMTSNYCSLSKVYYS